MWSVIMSILTGLWLMLSPAVFPFEDSAADNNYISGPLIITFAIMALWEINRQVLKANLLTAAWLMVALFLFPYTGVSLISNAASGVLLIILSLVKQKTSTEFGGGWKSLIQENPVHMREPGKEHDGRQADDAPELLRYRR